MGYKHISQDIKENLRRNRPRNARSYDNKNTILSNNEYKVLIESFTKDQYLLYEKYYHAFGTPGRKRHVMLDKVTADMITGPVRQLTEIRSTDLSEHQKLLQILRSRWTDISEYRVLRVNSDSEKFWFRLARNIVNRCKHTNKKLYKDWDSIENLELLVEYLKKLYKKQNGLCGLTKLPLELLLRNKNKCSADRIDSNKGYIPGNIWLVVLWANVMKLDTPMDEFLSQVSLIYKANNV